MFSIFTTIHMNCWRYYCQLQPAVNQNSRYHN